MAAADDISKDVQEIIDTPWALRKGQVIPDTQDVKLKGGSVELEATFLYADLADSSRMAKELDRRVTAKIIKSFLATSCKRITACGGKVKSFDGDRVMGVFMGGSKNTDAAKCALQINYVVQKIIRPKFEKKYETVKKCILLNRPRSWRRSGNSIIR